METIHVDFDELTSMASEQSSSGPALHEMTPRTISSGLVLNPPSTTPYVIPTKNDWDLLFQPMFDEYYNPPSSVVSLVHAAAAPRPIDPTSSPSSTSSCTLFNATGTMFLNMDQLQKQLDNNEFQEIGSMASFKVLKTHGEKQDGQQKQNMLDVLLVPIDEQVKIGLSNFRIALEKTQFDVIYKVCLAILQQYLFFNAFIRTVDAPEIMQHTVHYDLTAKAYIFTVDDQNFEVNADLLGKALQITPEVSDHPFTTPPPKNEIISFINKLGYSKRSHPIISI
ncbi:hypothetical protein Tco_0517152 [Tanacetum coccineum]